MASAKERGEYLHVADAVRAAQADPNSAEPEAIATRARQLQQRYAERGEVLHVADAVRLVMASPRA
jgi:hypothetical protein